MSAYSESAFSRLIDCPDTRLSLAETDGHLIGFAQLTVGQTHALAPAGAQSELLRLYVQEPFTGKHVGSRLLTHVERLAVAAGSEVLWLTPWVHNHRARRFYARRGYQDVGLTHFTFEGESHENRVCVKQLNCDVTRLPP